MNLNGLVMWHALNGDGDVVVATADAKSQDAAMKEWEGHLAQFSIETKTKKKKNRFTLPNGRKVTFLAAPCGVAMCSPANHVIVVNPHFITREGLRYILGGTGSRTYSEVTL